MPDRFPVLRFNSDTQNDEFMKSLVRVKTLHLHRTLQISVDFRVSFLMKHFLMKGGGCMLPPACATFVGKPDASFLGVRFLGVSLLGS